VSDLNAENIRKQVGRRDSDGSSPEREDVLDRMRGLRERMRRLEIAFEDDDEWIQKTVGGSGS